MKKMILVISAILFLLSVPFGQFTEDEDTTGGVEIAPLPEMSPGELEELLTSHITGRDPLNGGVRYSFEGDILFLNNTPRALDIDGNVVYVATDAILISVNITDPNNMEVLDEYNIGATLIDVEVRGNYAYVTQVVGSRSRLLLFDIADPGDIDFIDTIYATSSSNRQLRYIDLEGNVAYIACRRELLALDISDPEAVPPIPVLGSEYHSMLSKDIFVDGDWAYVSGSQIYVFDVSVPTTLVFDNTFPSSGMTWSIEVDGDYLFAADYSNGLKIFDITDPTSPSLLGSASSKYYACGVVVMGDWCYITSENPSAPNYYGAVNAYDVTDPESPESVDEYGYGTNPLFKAKKNGQTWVFAITRCQTVVPKLTSISVGMIDDYLLTEDIVYYATPYPGGNYVVPPSQLKVRGNWAMVVDSIGMHWINIANPADPYGDYDWGWMDAEEDAIFYGIDVSGNSIYLTSSAYLSDADGGLWVLDGADPPVLAPWSPSWTAHTSPDASVYGGEDPHVGNIGEIEVDGNVAYVFGMDDVYIHPINERDRLFLDSYDITDPEAPDVMDAEMATSDEDRPRYARQRMGVIEVVGDTIYSSVRIIPYEPFVGDEGATSWCMRDNHVHLFSIEFPSVLDAFLGTDDHNIGYYMDRGDCGGDIDVEGNVLYSISGAHDWGGLPLPDETCGLFVISYDISNSLGPAVYPTPDFTSVELDWGYLWWQEGALGMHDGPHPLDLLVDGDYGFASAGDIDFNPREGLWLLDVTEPDNMAWFFIGDFESGDLTKINGMDIAGDYLYAVGTFSDPPIYTHRFYSIKVYQRNHDTEGEGFFRRTADLDILPENLSICVSPNPFNSDLSISLSIPTVENLSLRVVDLSGRTACDIFDGSIECGVHEFKWNADEYTSGVYFVVANLGGEIINKNVLLLK